MFFNFIYIDVFSYDEDDMVEDPFLSQHLAHFGINITSMKKVRILFTFMKSKKIRLSVVSMEKVRLIYEDTCLRINIISHCSRK